LWTVEHDVAMGLLPSPGMAEAGDGQAVALFVIAP